MPKRIWFKPDCIKWIREGKKTTTFRRGRHEGIYEIVQGSRFKAKGLGIFLKLSVAFCDGNAWPLRRENVIRFSYDTEGDFHSPQDFESWLKQNKLELPEIGYLHSIELIKVE